MADSWWCWHLFWGLDLSALGGFRVDDPFGHIPLHGLHRAALAAEMVDLDVPALRLAPAHEVIARVRHTESSFTLSRAGRRRNLRGAFRVRGDVAGREVLLMDDIYTSGATARECARVLMAAGAAKVWVATLARAQKRHVARQHEDAGELVASWDMGTTTLEGR